MRHRLGDCMRCSLAVVASIHSLWARTIIRPVADS